MIHICHKFYLNATIMMRETNLIKLSILSEYFVNEFLKTVKHETLNRFPLQFMASLYFTKFRLKLNEAVIVILSMFCLIETSKSC